MIIASDDVKYFVGTADPRIADSEAAKAFIVSEGSRLCVAAAGANARAIVLTGSMSRGEATLKQEGESWRALGDATFLIISEQPVLPGISALESDIEASLSSKSIRCKVAVVSATTAQLRQMNPHIYAYELRERGVVLWGDKHALHLIPAFTAADIPQEDGWWFLCNRIIEQLESAAHAEGCHENEEIVRYRIAKLYLAMAACYLLTIGQYAPSYRDRAARLRQLAAIDHPETAPIPLQRFAGFVSQCTRLKLEGQLQGAANDFPEWRDAVADAEALWRWTLAHLTQGRAGFKRRDLIQSIAARQSIFARAKGWMRAAYVSRSSLGRNWLRWARLAWFCSPRYLIYRAASELFFTAADPATLSPDDLAQIVSPLPLTASENDNPLTWRTAATLIARNFHMFVESTRS